MPSGDAASSHCAPSSSSPQSVALTGEVDNSVFLTFSESIRPIPKIADFSISLIDTSGVSYTFTASKENGVNMLCCGNLLPFSF